MSAAALKSSPRVRGRVLVVDDDPDLRASVAELLEREGYIVSLAHDGDDALTQLLASRAPPDLIVLDLVMPRKSGHEVLQVLRNSVTMVDVPVVVLSAYIASPPAGAIAWIRKPFKPADLLRVIGSNVRD